MLGLLRPHSNDDGARHGVDDTNLSPDFTSLSIILDNLDLNETQLTTPQTQPLTPNPSRLDDDFPALDPSVLFDIQRAQTRRAGSFPEEFKIIVWNCRGIKTKYHLIWDLFSQYDADLVILNETFRPEKTNWPSNLPPCLGQATSSPDPDSNTRRNTNGVAVLANPKSLRPKGSIRKFEVLQVDNKYGTKVVLKINNFILYAVYTPTSLGTDLLATYLKEARDLSQNNQAVVLCGDINALPHIDDHRTPTSQELARHRALINESASVLIRADTGPFPTRPANPSDPNCTAGNILDHILGAHVDFVEPMCLHEFVHTSDHHPISVTFRPHNRLPDDAIRYWRLRTEKLNDRSVRENYQETFASGSAALTSTLARMAPADLTRTSPVHLRRQLVDSLEYTFVTSVYRCAETVLGRKNVPVVAHRGKRITPSTEYTDIKARLARNYALLRMIGSRTEEDEEVARLLASCDALKLDLSNLDKKDQSDSYKVWKDELCNLSATQRIKILNRSMRRRSAAGSSLPTTSSALASYRLHFKNQFQNNFNIPEYVPQHIEILPDQDVNFALEIFDDDSVLKYILESAAGKSPGLTGISADLLHPIAESAAPILSSLFGLYFHLDAIPSSWQRSLICPVPKKGDLSRISNYRPISLTEVTRKIYEMCLLEHMKSSVTLSREQGGFREGRSTIDQIEALDMVVRTMRQNGKQAHIAFLDIKAAYDSVPRAELWRRCEQLNIHPLIIDSLRALFDHNSAQLAINQRRSAPFGLSAGVLQGSVLSPLLYSIYLDPIVERLRTGPSIQLPLNDGKINCLLYADDIAIIAETAAKLKKLLLIAEEDSLARGYRFSPAKCVIVAPGQTTQRIYRLPLERVKSFCYLGVEFGSSGMRKAKHAQNRIDKALKAATMLKAAGARYHNFPVRVNLHLYAVFIRPGLEYGLTLITDHEKALRMINSCQKRIICNFLGVNPNSRNDIISASSNCPSMYVRRQLLRHNRAIRLEKAWDSPTWYDNALLYILRCVYGPTLRLPADVDTTQKYSDVRRTLFSDPLNSLLRQRSDGVFDRSLPRWLINSPATPGVIRTILLWMLGKWNPFEPMECKACHSNINDQVHVMECSNIHDLLLNSDLPVTPSVCPPMAVELCLIEIRSTVAWEHLGPALAALDNVIRQALSLVFERLPRH